MMALLSFLMTAKSRGQYKSFSGGSVCHDLILLVVLSITLFTDTEAIKLTKPSLPNHILAEPTDFWENEIQDVDEGELEAIIEEAWLEAQTNVTKQLKEEEEFYQKRKFRKKHTNEHAHAMFSSPGDSYKYRNAAVSLNYATQGVLHRLRTRRKKRYAPSGKKFKYGGPKLSDNACQKLINMMEDEPNSEPCNPNSPYRTYDGSCNNVANTRWGQVDNIMVRFLNPQYDDGVNSPRTKGRSGYPLPEARVIRTQLNIDLLLEYGTMTHATMQYGQYINHDITKKPDDTFPDGKTRSCCPDNKVHPSCLTIKLPSGDFLTKKYGQTCMEFMRGMPFPHPECTLGRRENMNRVTAAIDASTVYGENLEKSKTVRAFQDGLLKSSNWGLMPLVGTSNDPPTEVCKTQPCFLAGDDRVNQHPMLLAYHTLFVKEHNRLASILKSMHPNWDDEKIFQEARRIVIAVMQHITYNEYMGTLLGPELAPLFHLTPLKTGYYKHYSTDFKPMIANDFSSAGHRYGHSTVRYLISRLDPDYNEIPVMMRFADEFFNVSSIRDVQSGLGDLLRGMVTDNAMVADIYFTSELSQRLYEQNNPVSGLDLVSFNIQRARDAGLPPYVDYFKYCHNDVIKSWDDLNGLMRKPTIAKLQKLYKSVQDIDLYIGGLAEYTLFRANVGPTLGCLIAQQFRLLKSGDRFFYENGDQPSSFTPGQLDAIRQTSFSRLLCDNVDDMKTIQPRSFRKVEPGNERVPCNQIPAVNMEEWRQMD